LSSTRIKSPFGNGPGQTDVTIFHIPGLDVKVIYLFNCLGSLKPSLSDFFQCSLKVHYDSHTLHEERDRETLLGSLGKPSHERSDSGSSSGTFGGFNLTGGRKGGTKKASLFAWITLHSVPEETIISPHILDFLEQTLEPIPIPNQKSFDGASIATGTISRLSVASIIE